MKKSTLALLTTVIALTPLTVFAQDTQTSVQNNSNSAAAVGNGNLVIQNADQLSGQDQFGFGGQDTPHAQTSVQVNANEAAAIGNHNTISQDVNQTSFQGQGDINQYLPSHSH